ncbi:hypothetical protein GBAR_LOCUS609 [Geodia barretti]|uniref:Uncharacterized protein n=1 Tax=Geodia barretti TaxID=519541 RepID=A0AA35QT31_GEOBA|nr:hypothetical protein GBAR_LOCUS609 [Geodia barretti]
MTCETSTPFAGTWEWFSSPSTCSASDRDAQHYAGSHQGTQAAGSGGGGHCDGTAGARGHPGAGRQISGAAFGRSTAAGGHRPGPGHATQHHALRRTHLRTGPGDDQRSAGGDARVGGLPDDHTGGYPRTRIRPRGGRSYRNVRRRADR